MVQLTDKQKYEIIIKRESGARLYIRHSLRNSNDEIVSP